MDSTASGNIALLPIKPRFAEAIMRGEKKVEFRKMRLRKDVRYVVMYASRPISKVVGYFEIASIDEGTPSELWPRHSSEGGIEFEEFSEYFGNAARGFAILVGAVHCLLDPQPLTVLSPRRTAPQGVVYIGQHSIETLDFENASLKRIP